MSGLFTKSSADSIGEGEVETQDSVVSISKSKYDLLKKSLGNLHESIGNILKLLEDSPEGVGEREFIGVAQSLGRINKDLELIGNERVVEGVFNGEQMISSDGQKFLVPANYASKSKLVEGDILKLTVTKSGGFIYKQIGPVERKRITGKLQIDDRGRYFVKLGRKQWQVLPASITYYKGENGDEVVILVPKDATSAWAAVENVIKK